MKVRNLIFVPLVLGITVGNLSCSVSENPGSVSTDTTTYYSPWFYFTYDLRISPLLYIVVSEGDTDWQATVCDRPPYASFPNHKLWFRQEHLSFTLEEIGSFLVTYRYEPGIVDDPVGVCITDSPAEYDYWDNVIYRDFEEYSSDYEEICSRLGLDWETVKNVSMEPIE